MKIRNLSVSSIYVNEKQVPAIRLSGNWLANIGFKIGYKVAVIERPGSLVVNLVVPEEDE
jgi:hypothetical protein